MYMNKKIFFVNHESTLPLIPILIFYPCKKFLIREFFTWILITWRCDKKGIKYLICRRGTTSSLKSMQSTITVGTKCSITSGFIERKTCGLRDKYRDQLVLTSVSLFS